MHAHTPQLSDREALMHMRSMLRDRVRRQRTTLAILATLGAALFLAACLYIDYAATGFYSLMWHIALQPGDWTIQATAFFIVVVPMFAWVGILVMIFNGVRDR